MNKMNS